MSDKERFAAFKEEMVAENERKYGEEVRKKYGDEAVDASDRKMLGMSEKEYREFEQLGEEMVSRLEDALDNGGMYHAGVSSDSGKWEIKGV